MNNRFQAPGCQGILSLVRTKVNICGHSYYQVFPQECPQMFLNINGDKTNKNLMLSMNLMQYFSYVNENLVGPGRILQGQLFLGVTGPTEPPNLILHVITDLKYGNSFRIS